MDIPSSYFYQTGLYGKSYEIRLNINDWRNFVLAWLWKRTSSLYTLRERLGWNFCGSGIKFRKARNLGGWEKLIPKRTVLGDYVYVDISIWIYYVQGYYQAARELLNEANTSALVSQHATVDSLYPSSIQAIYNTYNYVCESFSKLLVCF